MIDHMLYSTGSSLVLMFSWAVGLRTKVGNHFAGSERGVKRAWEDSNELYMYRMVYPRDNHRLYISTYSK